MEDRALVQRLADLIGAGGARPASQLIVEELWTAVVEGSLETGERLPTARQLAIALGVSPRSIERAYAELARRGVVATRQGVGTFISLTQPSEAERARHRELDALCRDAVRRAQELGFDVDDVLDAIAELRTLDESQTQESGP
jgi:GntR family transcriptional regulator